MSRLGKLTRILEADPADTFVLYAIAQEHAREGRHADAIAFYDRCLAADPGYLYAHYHKAVSQREAGAIVEARATIARGIEAATAAGDAKALGESQSLLDSLE